MTTDHDTLKSIDVFVFASVTGFLDGLQKNICNILHATHVREGTHEWRLDLVDVTADHVEDGVEDLHVQLLHRQQLLLGLVEGERAGVDPPQPRPARDHRRHGRGEVGPRLHQPQLSTGSRDQ